MGSQVRSSEVPSLLGVGGMDKVYRWRAPGRLKRQEHKGRQD